MSGITQQIIVTPEALRLQAEAVKSQLSNLKAQWDEITAIVSGTVQYWNGEAAELQRKGFTEFIPKVEETQTRILDMANDLELLATTYEQGEVNAGAESTALPNDVIR